MEQPNPQHDPVMQIPLQDKSDDKCHPDLHGKIWSFC
jgi:hypothetical protein